MIKYKIQSQYEYNVIEVCDHNRNSLDFMAIIHMVTYHN